MPVRVHMRCQRLPVLSVGKVFYRAFFFLIVKVRPLDFPGGPVVKNPPASAGTQVQSLVWNIPRASGQPSPCTTTAEAGMLWSPCCAM